MDEQERQMDCPQGRNEGSSMSLDRDIEVLELIETLEQQCNESRQDARTCRRLIVLFRSQMQEVIYLRQVNVKQLVEINLHKAGQVELPISA